MEMNFRFILLQVLVVIENAFVFTHLLMVGIRFRGDRLYGFHDDMTRE